MSEQDYTDEGEWAPRPRTDRDALQRLLTSMNDWLGNDESLMIMDVIEWRDALAAALTATPPPVPTADLIAALESARDWMEEDGCDCGTDEPGTCGLCLVRAWLAASRAEAAPPDLRVITLCSVASHVVGYLAVSNAELSHKLWNAVCAITDPRLVGRSPGADIPEAP
jgi:hypothetical protein